LTTLEVPVPFIKILKPTTTILWSIVYILIIRRGFKYKTYGMPILACIMNLSMEFKSLFIFSYGTFFYLGNIAWFFLDLIIFYQIIIFFPKKNKLLFYLYLSFGLIFWFFIIEISLKINNWIVYSSFFQNFLMSLLFIDFLKKDDFPKGQSIYIGIFKFLGTFSAIVYLFAINLFPTFDLITKYIIFCIPICDIIYVYFFYKKRNKVNFDQYFNPGT